MTCFSNARVRSNTSHQTEQVEMSFGKNIFQITNLCASDSGAKTSLCGQKHSSLCEHIQLVCPLKLPGE